MNFNLGTTGERTVFPLSSISLRSSCAGRTGPPTFATSSCTRLRPFLSRSSPGVGTIAYGIVRVAGLRDAAPRSSRPSARRPAFPPCSRVEQLQFTLWEPAGHARRPAAGRRDLRPRLHRLEGRRADRGRRHARRATASRRSRSTSSATAAGRSARTPSIRAAGAAGDASARRPRHRPGRQRHDRLDRRRQRGRRAVADRRTATACARRRST